MRILRTILLTTWLAVLVAACGGEVTKDSSSGGQGGSSSSSSNSSSSNSSSGSVNECSDAILAVIAADWPHVGFGSQPSGPGTAAVQSIDAGGIDLSLGLDGPTLRFDWVGPDLSEAFAVGEIVNIGINETGWHFVNGTRMAAARQDSDFVAPDALPSISQNFLGPELSFVAQCTFPDSFSGCGQPQQNATALAVSAKFASESTIIDFGTMGAIGGWQVHNVAAVQYPSYGNDQCVVEAEFRATVTALGPVWPDTK